MSFVIITTLYLALFVYVIVKSKQNSTSLNQPSAVNTNRLAFKLSMFVLSYIIQFGGHAYESFWMSFEDVPSSLRYYTATSTAIGGIMNGIVYLTIRMT